MVAQRLALGLLTLFVVSLIISLGVVVPPWRNDKTGELPLGEPAGPGEGS